MIPAANITSWRATVPWIDDAQIEQDLVLSRALVEIFSDPLLKENFAFRGGTALHKIVFQPPGRYSEDIDLCRTTTGPIGPIIHRLRDILDPWLGTPRAERSARAVTLKYKFLTEGEAIEKRLKVEINVRETYNRFGLATVPFQVTNPWFTGQTNIVTYSVEELLATKLRALYQRSKGRDLFDLFHALVDIPGLNVARLIEGFKFYMDHQKLKIRRIDFEQNLARKESDPAFRNDMKALLPAGQDFDFDLANAIVLTEIISLLP